MHQRIALLFLSLATLVGGAGIGAVATRLVDAGTLAPSSKVTMPAEITSLVAINGTSAVAVGLADGRVAVWNAADPTPAITLRPHAARVLAVGASADGRFVLSVATDASLARTAIRAGATPALQKVDLGPAPTRAAVFSADGARLMTGGEFGDIRVFDTASGNLRHTLRGHRTELQDLAARPGSPLLASAGADADVRVWDTASGQQIAIVDGELSNFAVAFSPRDGTLASGGPDRRVTLRDPTTFASSRVFALKAPWMVSTLAWSADGRLVVVGDLDDGTLAKGGIQVVDASSLAVVATLDTGGTPASRVTCSARGNVVVAVVGRDVRAWTLAPSR